MKKLLAVSILALALCSIGAHAARIEPQVIQVQDQQGPSLTDVDKAAWTDFTKFAAAHQLGAAYRYDPDTKLWDLAFFTLDKDGNYDQPKWVVIGYTSLPDAVKQIEADFAQFPDGSQRDHTDSNRSGRQANV